MSEASALHAELSSRHKQTEVGVIPDDWDVEPVNNAFHICNHLRLPISEDLRVRMRGAYPYYGPTSIQGWINEYRVDGEYALIGEDGDHFLKWRTQSMTLLVRGRFNVNNHAHLVRGSTNLTSWFYWLFSHRDLTPFLTRQGAGRYKLTKAALATLLCPLPPPREQRAIAAALSDVDALIGALDCLIAKKRDLKQATMQQLLTGQTRLPGFTGKWTRSTVGSLGSWFSGGTPSMLVEAYWSGRIPWVSPKDMKVVRLHDAIDHVSEKALGAGTRLLPKGAILIVVRGMILAHSLPVARAERPLAFNQDIKALIVSSKYDSDFVLWWLLVHKPLLLARTTESTHGTKRLPTEALFTLEIAVPDSGEQTAIAAVLSDMDAEITALEQRRDKTRLLKQGMMQELLTGRIRLV